MWPISRQRDCFLWIKEVIDGLKGNHPAHKNVFDQVFEEGMLPSTGKSRRTIRQRINILTFYLGKESEASFNSRHFKAQAVFRAKGHPRTNTRDFFDSLKYSNFSEGTICPGGEIGRHARFRSVCFTAWGFESPPGHHISFVSLY